MPELRRDLKECVEGIEQFRRQVEKLSSNAEISLLLEQQKKYVDEAFEKQKKFLNATVKNLQEQWVT